MTSQTYRQQVALLLNVLPEVAKEKCFALHGGTAINLFVRNMPRISVDIDLTYLPLEERTLSLQNIHSALERIKADIEKVIPDVKLQHLTKEAKLLITLDQALIKLEVNTIIRGTILPPVSLVLCQKAQEEFDAFCEMPVVPVGQLFGGKIVAALDRQHPRDIFDVKCQLKEEGFTKQIKTGFLFCLLSSNRPIHELLRPHLQDQRKAIENQFEGMTDEAFPYAEYEKIRGDLISIIHSTLTAKDKQFLMSFFDAEPDWSIYDFKEFPAIRWKLQNLHAVKTKDPEKYEQLRKSLLNILNV